MRRIGDIAFAAIACLALLISPVVMPLIKKKKA